VNAFWLLSIVKAGIIEALMVAVVIAIFRRALGLYGIALVLARAGRNE
jgi:hypothetical protein